MEVHIANLVITTNHPASSYGFGVALIDGIDGPLGPSDVVMVGTDAMTVGDFVMEAVNWKNVDENALRQIKAFLSQSPVYPEYARQIAEIRRQGQEGQD